MDKLLKEIAKLGNSRNYSDLEISVQNYLSVYIKFIYADRIEYWKADYIANNNWSCVFKGFSPEHDYLENVKDRAAYYKELDKEFAENIEK